MEDRERRIGENEAIFREVNERVRDTNETFDVRIGEAEFVCECGSAACTGHVRMRLEEYERVRADPATFLVLPRHDEPDVEIVVERHDPYWVVRKHEGEAEAFARRTDPRR
jgi:hypothetical protein